MKRNTNYLDKLMKKEVAEGGAAGNQLLVMQRGEVLYHGCHGFADIKNQRPMSTDTIYRLYSMSKPIASAAAMILYERGQLDFYMPVSEYLPAYKGQKVLTEQGLVNSVREVEIRDLMNMTAGIVYPDESFEAGRRMERLYQQFDEKKRAGREMTTRQFMELIAQAPLEFQPGEHWRYGACADVLGAVIEVISGQTYGEFLKKEIFEPLKMKDTAFYVPEEKRERFAQIYCREEGASFLPLEKNILALGDYLTPPAFESAGAGLVSTCEDYNHFLQMLVQEGRFEGVRLLGRKTVEYMRRNQLTPAQRSDCDWESLRGYGYGNFMRSLIEPELAVSNGSVGEFGWDGWCGNYMAVDPKENLTILYFVQNENGNNFTRTRRLRDVIYSMLD